MTVGLSSGTAWVIFLASRALAANATYMSARWWLCTLWIEVQVKWAIDTAHTGCGPTRYRAVDTGFACYQCIMACLCRCGHTTFEICCQLPTWALRTTACYAVVSPYGIHANCIRFRQVAAIIIQLPPTTLNERLSYSNLIIWHPSLIQQLDHLTWCHCSSP